VTQGVVLNSTVMNKSGSVPVSISKYNYNPGFALVTKRTGRPSGADLFVLSKAMNRALLRSLLFLSKRLSDPFSSTTSRLLKNPFYDEMIRFKR
jgi:hypothetical protein